MRTRVEIVVEPGRRFRHRASGGLAVRQTGSQAAHLIGTAATPLGGDDIEVRVIVEAGAHLDLGSVAATIALPSTRRVDSTMSWHIELGPGARLYLHPQPTVVAAGADHRSEIVVAMSDDAILTLAEDVQIGRAAELGDKDAGGHWEGGLHVDVGDVPALRHRVALGVGSTAQQSGLRATSSVFRYPDTRADQVDPEAFAARLSLASGGSLATALGATVTQTRRLVDEMELATMAP